MNLTEGGSRFRAPRNAARRAAAIAIRGSRLGESAGRFGATVRPLDPARRLTALPANSGAPAAGARIKEPSRTIEVACFLRYCLLAATDNLILMVRRRVADLWRTARMSADRASTSWATLYTQLLADLGRLVGDQELTDTQARQCLADLVILNEQRRPRSKSQIARERLIEAIRPVRGLLRELVRQPWQASDESSVIEAITVLRNLYERQIFVLPDGICPYLGSVWRDAITGLDRERAFRALEVGVLLGLRRALRNGSVWIAHSLNFCSRKQLFIPEERWAIEARRHYSRLSLPPTAKQFLTPVLNRLTSGLHAVAAAAESGKLSIDDDLHLKALEAEDEDPEVVKLRAALNERVGEAQLPELILAVDAQVRFSWIMLGREPRSTNELLMVYAGILAHGTALSAAECARMIPQLSASSIRQAMRWATDERRLGEACAAVLESMHRYPIAATWGRDDLASSDMMSMETSKRVWQARLDPRRQTPSVGIYTHVRDRWGIFYAQPIVLNERQAGAAIEGVVRQEPLETAQLAVDTHGYTDFAMMLARLLGFDLCPRLKNLKQRRLYVPRGATIPEAIKPICVATADTRLIEAHWDRLVHLTASVHTGHTSAVGALARFGSASRGDPIYEAGAQLGRLLRTVFLTDYFVNDAFRRELLRVLNRGEAVNALKRAIYTGRVGVHQARRDDEMQAVADALSLLANIVMAWNTAQMQAVIDRWNNRRREQIPAKLIGRIAPTRIEGINLRGVFRFPIERFASQILPSLRSSKTVASAR
jgi:TnpA family transposase